MVSPVVELLVLTALLSWGILERRVIEE